MPYTSMVTKNVIRRNRLTITSFSEFQQSRLVLFMLLTGFLHTFVEFVALKRYVLPRFTISRETLQNWFNSSASPSAAQSLNVEYT